MIIHLSEPPADQERSTIYFPMVFGGLPVAALDPVAEMARLLTTDPRQQRRLTLHPHLATSALWRAHGLANGGPWGHVDSHGVTANEYVRRAGCRLPSNYDERGNNIESLSAGSADPAIIFAHLAASPSHSAHLFGRGDFFKWQTHFGIAMVAGGKHGWYWAIHIAQCLCMVSGE
jgi:hypothetical protein